MKDNRERFEPLECLLPCDREDAVSMTELAKVMEISPRELRQFILDARMEGLPILSDSEVGYWESDDETEIKEFIERRREVAKTIYAYTRQMFLELERRERHNEEK